MTDANKSDEYQDLAPRRERFCQEYVKDLNGARAARDAGYSEETANREAHRLLNLPAVQQRVEQLQAEHLAALQVTSERTLQEISRIAFTTPDEIMSWGPKGVRLKPSAEISPDALAAVAEVSQVKGRTGRMSVKMHDKLKALELLGRHLKLFTDQVQHSGLLGVQIVDDIPPQPKGDS